MITGRKASDNRGSGVDLIGPDHTCLIPHAHCSGPFKLLTGVSAPTTLLIIFKLKINQTKLGDRFAGN